MSSSNNPGLITTETVWVQLNERCRAYTSQIWQVPGLYFGLVAWVISKPLPVPTAVVAFIMAVVSFVVWVFVAQLTLYQQRAVRQMQAIEKQSFEGPQISRADDHRFLSFAWYVKWLVLIATFGFLGWSAFTLCVDQECQWAICMIGFLALAAIVCVLEDQLAQAWKEIKSDKSLAD